MKKQDENDDIKSRNIIKIDNTLELDFVKSINENSQKQLAFFPQISPKASDNFKSAKAFAFKRTNNRQEKLYDPYTNERDGMGRLIGSDSSQSNILKVSPRHMLPSVFQFNSKWAAKQATKNTLQGDYESREVSYSADMNYIFEKNEDMPMSWKNLSFWKIQDESIWGKLTNDTSKSNLIGWLNLWVSKNHLKSESEQIIQQYSGRNL